MVSHDDDTTPDPVLDERVRSVLEALAAPTEPGPLPGEVEAVAAFRAQHRTRRSSMTHLTPFRVAVASAVGAGVFLTGGVAAAANGSLPGAAQDVAHDVIAALPLGFEVPAGENAPEQADERGTDATEAEPVDGEGEAEVAENGKGEEIRELATDEGTSGLDKGRAVSEEASDGKSRAGEEGTTQREAGQQRAAERGANAETSGDAGDNAPVEAPDDGGSGTADDATTTTDDGAPTRGTGTADTKSGARSSAGPDNGERP